MSDKKIIQRIIVGGVLVNKENKALILQRHSNETTYPNMWELPSGRREFFEVTEGALIREMKEEAGVDVKIIDPISVFDYIIEKTEETRDSVQINFLVCFEKTGQKIVLSSEHQNFAWVNEQMLSQYNLTDSTKKVLVKAFNMIDKKK